MLSRTFRSRTNRRRTFNGGGRFSARLRRPKIFYGDAFGAVGCRESSVETGRAGGTAADATPSTCRNSNPRPACMTENFEFQFPWLLGLLALLPVYALLRGNAGKLSALKCSSADIARASGAKAKAAAGHFLFFLRLLVVALGIVALAEPRLANYHVETETAGIDIMLVLDLSWSMTAVDMAAPGEKITRFDIADEVLGDFIRKRPNDRMGLVAFSGEPYLASPLTLNHEWLVENLNRLHIGTIGDLGTAIGDAIVVAAKRLKAVPNSKSRVIILLTDGDNNKGEQNNDTAFAV